MKRPAANLAILLATLPIVPSACSDSDASRAGWEARVDTIGDTIHVHTVSGSVLGGTVALVEQVRIGQLEGADELIFGSVAGLTEDAQGNIYVYDRQVPALRKYGPDGAFIANIGHSGEGPGEYSNSDGGLNVLPDGRVILRDPGNARYTLYRPDGSYDSEWLGRGGFFTSDPLVVDTAGHAYAIVIRQPREGEETWPGKLWVTEFARMNTQGQALDTLSVPRYDFEAKEIVASRDGGTSVNNVPFTGQFLHALHPHGGIVTAIGDRMAIDYHRPDGAVVRMSRDVTPVPVQPDEKADAEERATRNMRGTVPDWRWNGAPIPDTKAPITALLVGRDGRIWAQVAAPAEVIPEEERTPQVDPDRPPPPRFRTPVVYEVFEPDGRYVGRVEAPRGFSTYPRPLLARDHVWAVMRDELDVNYVVRFSIGGGTP